MYGSRILVLAAAVTISGVAFGQRSVPSGPAGGGMAAILERIQAPTFLKKIYTLNVTDSATDIKPALDSAIQQCSVGGGGEVLVPKGTYFIKGPIVLKSHVNLHLDEGARIKFSSDERDYLPAVLTLW